MNSLFLLLRPLQPTMSSDSPLFAPTKLMRDIFKSFEGAYAKMNIRVSTDLFSAHFTRKEMQRGREISFSDLDTNQDGSITLDSKRIALYIPDNPGSRVHITHCHTLARMQKRNLDSRYTAKLPTRAGFHLENGRYKWLEVCRHCLNHENLKLREEYGVNFKKVTSESMLALIVAEFTKATGRDGDIITEQKLRAANSASLRKMQEDYDDVQGFRTLSSTAKRAQTDQTAIEDLTRLNFADADRALLEALAVNDSIRFSHYEKLYSSASECRAAIEYFTDQLWHGDIRIRRYIVPNDNLFMLESRK